MVSQPVMRCDAVRCGAVRQEKGLVAPSLQLGGGQAIGDGAGGQAETTATGMTEKALSRSAKGEV